MVSVHYNFFNVSCHTRDEIFDVFFCCMMSFVLLVTLVPVVCGKALAVSSSFSALCFGCIMAV